MVRSDLASSGVMFSIDTESGFKDAILVTSAYGLGENVVQGAVNPDQFYVFKPTLKKGFKPIIILRRRLVNDIRRRAVAGIRDWQKDRLQYQLMPTTAIAGVASVYRSDASLAAECCLS